MCWSAALSWSDENPRSDSFRGGDRKNPGLPRPALPCSANFVGYVRGIGGIVQATLRMYRLRVLAPGRRFVESTPVMRLESSGRPDSRESTPPDSRPGLHNRSQGDIGAAPGGFELPTFNPCARELRKS